MDDFSEHGHHHRHHRQHGHRPHHRHRRKERPPWVGLLASAAGALLVGLVWMGLGLFYVPSGSMLPTLALGDQFLADKLIAVQSGPKRGEIWVFRNPEPDDGNGERLVKRVIGLPGETVDVHDGKVFVNGKPLEEPYLAETPDYDTEKKTLLKGEYWMLGDNRNHSHDSHDWGPVHRDSMIGRAFFRFSPVSRIGLL